MCRDASIEVHHRLPLPLDAPGRDAKESEPIRPEDRVWRQEVEAWDLLV